MCCWQKETLTMKRLPLIFSLMDHLSAVLFLSPLPFFGGFHSLVASFFKVYNTDVSAFLGTTAHPEL